MKLFVTGATGFIGRAFCQEASRRGHRILALTRDANAAIAPEVETAVGSLDDTPWRQVARFAPDAALHLAWISVPGVYLVTSENETWLEQSKAWFRRLIELGVPYVAGTGTCIEYAASNEHLHEERSPLDPQYPYSKAKAALFDWLSGLADVNWAWFRIFFSYGAGEYPGRYPSTIVRQLIECKVLKMNAPNSVRDYIECRDIASALCSAIESRVLGAINIGTGTGVSIVSIAERIAALLNADQGLIQHNIGAAPDPTPTIIADAGRLLHTGWRPRIGIDEGLQRLIDSLPHRT